jgi:DNA-binding MarR family transcriptional regulator
MDATETVSDVAVGLSPAHMAAWRGFIEAHARVSRTLAGELQAEQDMPITWYDVLVQLSEAPDGRLRMQDLADRVLLSQSGLTRLVDRLEREGYVSRQRCASDGRGLFAVLTPAGLDAIHRAYPTHLRGVQTWFADLMTAEEAALVAAVLTRVADTARPPVPAECTEAEGRSAC